MKPILLDTCICIELFHKNPNVIRRMNESEKTQIFISEITLAELLVGAQRSKQPEKEFNKIENLLNVVQVLTISNIISRFAKEKARLLKQGTPIEDFDILIGATAAEHSLMLITDNTKHLSRIENLELENWK